MSTTTSPRRDVPTSVRKLPLGERIRWARTTAKLSHDRLVEKLGRSNRGHLIKVEKGSHTPRPDLRDAIADATNVPRELFDDESDEEEADHMLALELLAVLRRVKSNAPTAHLAASTAGASTEGE